MEELWAAEKNFNLCIERIFGGCKKVPWLNGLLYILHTSSYENLLACSSGTWRKFGECRADMMCVADMSATLPAKHQ